MYSPIRSPSRLRFGAAMVISACGLASAQAQAQGKLDARYTASLAGITLGKGAWVIDIADDQYTAAASGKTTGLLQVIANGQGTGASRGHVVGGAPVPASYAASITADKKTDEVRMTLARGNVREFAVSPPPPEQSDRIPVTAAHRHGVSDPMSASLVRVPGKGPVVTADACKRTVPVFDGRMRYDLALSYKRMDHVKADKGYEGPAVVCAIRFKPIAGYVPGRTAITYLTKQHDMEVWLAPVAGTRVLVPFRISIPTPIGHGVLQATQFVTQAIPDRPTPAAVKAN